MKRIIVPIAALLFVFSIYTNISCNETESKQSVNDDDSLVIDEEEIIPPIMLTKEQQTALTPDTVLQILKARNLEYIEDNLTIRNTSARIRKASLGQYPAATIVSCLDSRVPVEDVFHSGIGDLFVARVAGNVVNEDILGSLEFACKVSGAKLIVILGHEHCGAIKSAIDKVELGNITALLAKIQQSMKGLENYQGDKTSSNPAYLEAVTKQNVLYTIDQIRSQSPILKEMEDKGELKIVGAEYHMETGRVDFF